MKAKTISEIRPEGLEVLAKALGPIGMVRFVQSFDTPHNIITNHASDRIISGSPWAGVLL